MRGRQKEREGRKEGWGGNRSIHTTLPWFYCRREGEICEDHVSANSYCPPLLLFIGHRASLHVAEIQFERVMRPEDSTLIPRSISAQSRRASVIQLWVPQGGAGDV